MPNGIDIYDINYDSILNYIERRRSAGIRGQTIRREVGLIKRALKIAKRKGYIQEIIDELPIIRNDPPNENLSGKYWPAELIQLYLDELHQEAKDECIFAAATGLRYTEVKRVQRSFVELIDDHDTPALLHMPDWATKNRKARDVGLPFIALEIIERRVRENPEALWVFSQSNFKRARALACKRLGFKRNLTLRDLRHSLPATHCLEHQIRQV